MLTSCGVSKQNKDDLSAYLMVYFKDNDHSLHMALSTDGKTFNDINKGKAVIAGDTIAEQKGIRDPHIYKGPDGIFYLAMTDLHLFAQDLGYRNTRWERSDDYGWGNNRGLVLMKSNDLIHWSKANIRIDKTFSGYDDIGCAWAPQTIYDYKVKKMMVYFTMRMKNERTKLYYAYTDDDFTKFISEPQILFKYPNEKIQVLDADIVRMPNGKYCMTYVAQENPGGIKMAFSNEINKGYVYQGEWIDKEPKACEAPNVWKRLDNDKWILMYDIFSINPHNFGFLETTDFVNFKDLGHFNEGEMKTTNFTSPKHGAVVHLTKNEALHLSNHWDMELSFENTN